MTTQGPMSTLQFMTSPIYGCCTTGELLEMGKVDKPGFEKLKAWALEEMAKRGIEVK